ncbi:MAG: hypothetical protein IH624_14175 [Phycisphaerae bacterium]|nr:hypothetical protein [Phycisphaerae bacterium]
MGRKVRITAGQVTVSAELSETPTAEAIHAVLPIQGLAQRWGGEIYFSTPVTVGTEADAREELQAGELAYWAPGKAFCVFFGPTPASNNAEPKAASAVNVFGKITGDTESLWEVADGEAVVVESLEGERA